MADINSTLSLYEIPPLKTGTPSVSVRKSVIFTQGTSRKSDAKGFCKKEKKKVIYQCSSFPPPPSSSLPPFLIYSYVKDGILPDCLEDKSERELTEVYPPPICELP